MKQDAWNSSRFVEIKKDLKSLLNFWGLLLSVDQFCKIDVLFNFLNWIDDFPNKPIINRFLRTHPKVTVRIFGYFF